MVVCSVVTHDETPTIGVRAVVRMDEMPAFFKEAYGQLFEVTGREGLSVVGQPFGRYRGTPTETVDVEAGVPIAEVFTSDHDVIGGTLPGTDVVEAIHVGPYDTMEDTYSAMRLWMRARGLHPLDDVWEVYLTDPAMEPDPANWQTKIVWPFISRG